MIEELKKLIWKVDEMRFSDNPSNSKTIFQLKYGSLAIGFLTYDNGIWSFQYTEEFKKSQLTTITNFPDKDKVYTDKHLWPFFATRIPTLNQPFQLRKIKKANACENDAVALLKIFGRFSINNPFKLELLT